MFKCQECGKKYAGAKSAERATINGCLRCGGVDIDLDPDAPSIRPSRITYIDRSPVGSRDLAAPPIRLAPGEGVQS